MPMAMKASYRRGQHWDLARKALNRLAKANLAVKSTKEREVEYKIVGHLQAYGPLGKQLITQVGADEVDKIQQASLFGFKHRPDTTIGNDGTAIEVKVIRSGPTVRDILGQSIAYRMDYRFVILVLVDRTRGRKVVSLCKDKKTREHQLLSQMANELNVFSIVGPGPDGKNVVFK